MTPTKERQHWTPLSSALRKKLLKFVGKVIPRDLNGENEWKEKQEKLSRKAVCKIRLFCFYCAVQSVMLTKYANQDPPYYSPHPEDLLLNHKTFKNCASDVYNQDTHWEAESNQLRTSIESWGSMFPCSQQNFPCVPCSVPWKYFVDFGFPCSPNNAFVPVFQFYFPFVPMLPKS